MPDFDTPLLAVSGVNSRMGYPEEITPRDLIKAESGDPAKCLCGDGAFRRYPLPGADELRIGDFLLIADSTGLRAVGPDGKSTMIVKRKSGDDAHNNAAGAGNQL